MRYEPKANLYAKQPTTRFFTRSRNRIILKRLIYLLKGYLIILINIGHK